ncbi:non-classical arabinogalactan protein 31-like [Tasmannia lanceolata]|uniref:non-classical arabinogalactan protein 31-like n=1 Tax=Tasmannia lanceolata TaxID=3420 RepID=UPI004062CA93
MGFLPMSLVRALVMLQIFLFLTIGSFDSNTAIEVEGLEFSEGLKALPPRSLVAVQGVIYCKSCKYVGVDTLLGASPLSGAVARLQCKSSKREINMEGKTDKNGYFYIQAANVTTYGVHKCKVFLASSPLETCKNATDLHGGVSGARLRPEKVLMGPKPVMLFSVGPLAYAPTNTTSCRRSP